RLRERGGPRGTQRYPCPQIRGRALMQPQTRDLHQILQAFRRRWWMIAAIVLAVTVGTYYYYKHLRPRYTASTSVFVRSAGSSPVAGTDPETDPSRRLQNEATLLQ